MDPSPTLPHWGGDTYSEPYPWSGLVHLQVEIEPGRVVRVEAYSADSFVKSVESSMGGSLWLGGKRLPNTTWSRALPLVRCTDPDKEPSRPQYIHGFDPWNWCTDAILRLVKKPVDSGP